MGPGARHIQIWNLEEESVGRTFSISCIHLRMRRTDFEPPIRPQAYLPCTFMPTELLTPPFSPGLPCMSCTRAALDGLCPLAPSCPLRSTPPRPCPRIGSFAESGRTACGAEEEEREAGSAEEAA
eukprot:508438-Hanusia_phi.AAC.2